MTNLMEWPLPGTRNSPTVSIVTPTYNQGQYIERMIKSIRAQRYPWIEHIVVDGGSTDQTTTVLRDNEDAYRMRWISESDSGMYEAINKGLRLATGDIIGCLNSDDHYFPWTVDVAVKALVRNPDATFVYGDMINIDDTTSEAALHFYPPFRLEHLRRFGFLGYPTVFWRRTATEESGYFDESFQLVGDCEYWMRLGARYHGIKVNEVLAVEHDHSQAKRMAQAELLRKELIRLREEYLPESPLARRVSGVSERLYAALWHRIDLVAFLCYARRAPAGLGHSPWREFLSSGLVTSLNMRSGALAFLPFTRGRFTRGLLQLRELG